MFTIRLKKIAFKNNLTYNIVIMPSYKSSKSSQFIEKIGHYKPLIDSWANKYTFIDIDRMLFWLNKGASVNKSVFLIIKALIINSKNLNSTLVSSYLKIN